MIAFAKKFGRGKQPNVSIITVQRHTAYSPSRAPELWLYDWGGFEKMVFVPSTGTWHHECTIEAQRDEEDISSASLRFVAPQLRGISITLGEPMEWVHVRGLWDRELLLLMYRKVVFIGTGLAFVAGAAG